MKKLTANKTLVIATLALVMGLGLAAFKNTDNTWIVGDQNPAVDKVIKIGGGTLSWSSGNSQMEFSNDGGVTPVEIGTSTEIPSGATFDFTGSTAPTGYVLASGGTIGSGTSGSTERANADTVTLFTLLWNSFSNTELVIQDAAGSPTTRGGSAAADFSANKRLPTPDLRGRVIAGKDDMGVAGSANRLSVALNGDTLGAAGGSQEHTLSAAESGSPAHLHTMNHGHANTIATTSAGAHTHDVQAGGGGAGGLNDNVGVGIQNTYSARATSNGAHTHPISGSVTSFSGSTSNSSAVAAGSAHTNTQPTFILLKIIKL